MRSASWRKHKDSQRFGNGRRLSNVKRNAQGISTLTAANGETDAEPKACPEGLMPTSPNEDHADIDAVFAGDRSAFGKIVRRHDPALRRLACSVVRDASAVDDVLQEAYLKAFRSLGSYRTDRSFSAWLHRITYTTALDYVRKRSRHAEVALDSECITHPSGSSESQSRLDVAAALHQLPLKQRTAALLVDGHGYSYADVATILDIPSGTVAFQLHLARKALRRLLAASEGAEQ
jgi:RNA polymerase sigma-70 factor (ECF subfamily)